MTTLTASPATWHGTTAEAQLLVAAVNHYCTCVYDGGGALVAVCPAHRMLVEDQRALNGLLFARRIREQLIREEMSPVEAELPS